VRGLTLLYPDHQCWISVTFWCGSAPLDYPSNGSGSNSDPTPLFRDLKDAKKKIISPYFFLITYPKAHYSIFSLKN
jgi:hypothetical protein